MKNHLNILPKLASFDLKCSKMRWRLRLRPRPRWGSLRRSPRPPNRRRQRAFGARHSLLRVHFYISIPLSNPSLTEFLDPPLVFLRTCCMLTMVKDDRQRIRELAHRGITGANIRHLQGCDSFVYQLQTFKPRDYKFVDL